MYTLYCKIYAGPLFSCKPWKSKKFEPYPCHPIIPAYIYFWDTYCVFLIFSAYSPLNSANSSLFSELTLVWLVVGYQLREAKRVCILCRKAHFLWTASSFTAEHSGFFLGCAHLLIAYHFWDWLSNFEEMVRQCRARNCFGSIVSTARSIEIVPIFRLMLMNSRDGPPILGLYVDEF